MRFGLRVVLAALVVALTACNANDGPVGPQPLRCVDLAVEDCDARPDCAEQRGWPLGRSAEGEWCLDLDAVHAPVACIATSGEDVPGLGVVVYLAPVGDEENCHMFGTSWPHLGTWEACSPLAPTGPCP